MTPIAKSIAAAALAAPLALPNLAAAQATLTPDQQIMLERLQIRQAVTSAIADAYGMDPSVVGDDDDRDELQADVAAQLQSGQPLPEGVNLQTPPEPLLDLLPTVEGAEWAMAGDHLIAVQNGTAAVVVWDILP